MGFSDYARDHAKTSLEAVVRQVADAARVEIERLQDALDERVAAVTAAVASVDHGAALDALVQDLDRAAAEQAAAAAAGAREQAQIAADTDLTVVRAEAQARLDAEAVAKAALTETLERSHQQVVALQEEIEQVRHRCAAFEQELGTVRHQAAVLQDEKGALEAARAAVEAVRREIEARLAQEQAARADLETTLAVTLQNKKAAVDAARAEAESRLGHAHTAQTDLEAALAEAQRDAERARGEAQATAAGLQGLQARLEAVEAERAEIEQARDEVIALLEGETPNRTALNEALDEARRAADAARADMQARARSAATALQRVNSALHAFDDASSAQEIYDVFVAQLAHGFARVALFLVRDKSLEGALSVGFEPTTTVTNVAIPLNVASPLTRAVIDEAPVVIDVDAATDSAGLFGGSGEGAIALPVRADGRVIAVAYAEQPRTAHGADSPDRYIAELIADHASRCLCVIATTSAAGEVSALPPQAAAEAQHANEGTPPAARAQEAPPAAFDGPIRQAPRVRMHGKFEISIDGGVGTLIDISSVGAQILTPKSMRPNHAVRMIVPRDEGAVRCKGRVVWAALEAVRSDGTPLYRAGVRFTEVDGPALEAFIVHHSRAQAGAQRPRAG